MTCQNTKMAEYRGVSRTQLNIYDGALLQKQLTTKAVNYFRKKVPSLVFEWFLNMPLEYII